MSQHQNAKTRKWFFVCIDFNGKQKKRMRDALNNQFSTKREARAAEVLFKDLDDKYKNGEQLSIKELEWLGYDPSQFKNTQVTFLDLQREHRSEYIKNKKQRTIEKYDSVISKHILPFFENMDITEIHQRDILNWKNEMLEKKLGKVSLDRAFHLLASILQHAMTYYDLEKNVAKIVGTFNVKKETTEMLFWEREEFQTFIESLDADQDIQFENIVLFSTLFFTGIRAGELLALQWSDFDVTNSTITITKSIARSTVTTPKTQNSIRTLTVPNRLKELLLELKKRKSKFYNFNDSFFIFGGSKFLTKSPLDRRWYRALENSSVKRIRLHDLRHSHATMLFRDEYNILYISKRLGHATLEQTTKTYVHLAKEIQDRDNIKIREL